VSVDWPTVSAHAASRFAERGREAPVGPRAAWIQGRDVGEPHGCDADAVRYHAPSNLALLVRNGVLVTCIAVDGRNAELARAVARGGVVA
jgi:hypothetical protein